MNHTIVVIIALCLLIANAAALRADSVEAVQTYVQDPATRRGGGDAGAASTRGAGETPSGGTNAAGITAGKTAESDAAAQKPAEVKPADTVPGAERKDSAVSQKPRAKTNGKPAAKKPQTKAAAKKPGARAAGADKLAAVGEDRAALEGGIMLHNAGNYTAAIERFKQFKTSFPQSPYQDLASQWLARSYLRLGDAKNAVATLEAIPPASGEYPAALYLAGQILFAEKDYAGSGERFYAVSARFPEHELADDALIALARVNVAQGSGTMAVENLLKVIRLYADRETVDDAYFNLGKVYETDTMLRDLARAREVYRTFTRKADEGEPRFASSPLLPRVKRDLEYINRTFFPESPLR
jgi:TolA-binding protein